MTQQYLAGELSMRLGQLQATIEGDDADTEISRLRTYVERGPVPALPCAVLHALDLCDRMCWEALAEGDEPTFTRRAKLCAELWEFGICAGLVDDREIAAA